MHHRPVTVLSVLVALSALAPPATAQRSSTFEPTACATALVDTSNPSRCLQASSVPRLGQLFPLTPELFVLYPQRFVGIGTTEPTARLDVAGDVQIRGRTPWADVRAFGAVGDDATDDTAALQAAIGAAGFPGGGVVLVPPGIYRHTGLSLRANVSLVGVGAKVSILKHTPTTGACLTIPPGQGTNIKIRNLKLEALSAGAAVAIRATGTTRELVLEDYEIERFRHGLILADALNVRIGMGRWLGQGRGRGGTGMHITGNAVVIEQPYLSDWEQGIFLQAHGSTIQSAILELCTHGIKATKNTTIAAGWFLCDRVAIEAADGGSVISHPYILNPITISEEGDPFASGQITLSGAGVARTVTLLKGKAYIPIGVDPAYVSFSAESRDGILRHAATLTEHEDAMLFWHAEAGRMEVYSADDGRFQALAGEPGTTLAAAVRELAAENERLQQRLAALERAVGLRPGGAGAPGTASDPAKD